MPHSIRSAFPLVVTVYLLSAWSWAQQKSTPASVPIPDFSRAVDLTERRPIEYQEYEKGLLTFSTKAQYVLVPAVVTDKDGNPVSGLKKQDFVLEENGKKQVISSVDEIVPAAGVSSKAPGGNPNVASNELAIQNRAPQRLIIIAIDMVDTPFFDQVRARQQVISYLSETLEENSLYQVVSIEDKGLRVLHDYTQNSADLIATLRKVRSHFTAMDRLDPALFNSFGAKIEGPVTSVTPGATAVGPSGVGSRLSAQTDFEEWALAERASTERPYAQMLAAKNAGTTLAAFQQIAQRASGIPGRKSLVWITGGFPFSLDPATASVSEGVPFDIYQHVMQELSDQMIAVYPVDARGLLTTSVDATVRLPAVENFNQSYMVADKANRQTDILDTMRLVADLTGGRAFVNTNDTTGAVRSAAEDGSRYYLLTYPLDKSNRRQGWRKITVKAGSYHVRARKGYYLTQTTIDPASAARFDINSALTSPLDYTGVPLTVFLKPAVTAENKRKISFATAIPAGGITVDTADNNHLFIDVSYLALTPQGDSAFKEDKSYNVNLNPEQLQQLQSHGFGFPGAVEVAPGAYKLRVVVRDNLNGHVGSVQAELHAE
jgi:VWFA-related protein